MQLPPVLVVWRAQILRFWQQYRSPCIAALAIVISIVGWVLPVSHSWIMAQAANAGIISIPSESIATLPHTTPTPDTLADIQKTVTQLSTTSQAEAASHSQDETQLQTILTDLDQAMSQLNQSDAQLARLIGLSPTDSPTSLPNSTSGKTTLTTPKSTATASAKVSSLAPPTPSASAGDGLVHLNSATEAELESLPGIGPSYADRIITYRLQHGGFTTIDDLQNIKGIGPATLAKLKPHLAL